MSRKGESTSDKIVRLYKEGRSFEEIAKEIGMPKDNVPKILEKHMPDYEEYTPETSGETQDKEEKKKKKPFGFFNKKEKNPVAETQNTGEKASETTKEESKPESKNRPQQPTINLAMNEDGFVDSVVRGIASMLKNGKDVDSIAEFFNRSEEDINAVRECMDEHFRRSESGEKEEKPVNSEPTVSNSAYNLTGLEGSPVIKQTRYNAPDKEEPEVMDEMPSIDPVSLDELDKQIEAMGTSSQDSHQSSEAVPEMESVAFEGEKQPEQEVSAVVETETEQENTADTYSEENTSDEENVQPAEKAEIPENSDTTDDTVDNTQTTENEEEISFTLNEEDESMSPMEKMKMFAKQQIELNNAKIEELKAKREEILAPAKDIDSQIADGEITLAGIQSQIKNNEEAAIEVREKVAEVEQQLAELKGKLEAVENESAQIAKQADDITAKAEELKAKKADIQKEAESVEAEIAEVEKENKEFAEYC